MVAGGRRRRLRTVEVNGYRLVEQQVEATSAAMLRPSGEHIVTFMAESPSFEGIGMVKARRLWETFGERLYDILDHAEVDTLASVLTLDSARKAVSAWRVHGDSRTLQWLQAQGFDVALGRKVTEFFGAETPDRIDEDPYRLLSFCASWRQVDAMAKLRFGVTVDDRRRLQGAVEEACYRIFTAGHTVALSSTLMATLEPILGGPSSCNGWRDLVSTALAQGLSNGSFVIGHHGVQPLGAMVMEAVVARALADRVRRGQRPDCSRGPRSTRRWPITSPSKRSPSTMSSGWPSTRHAPTPSPASLVQPEWARRRCSRPCTRSAIAPAFTSCSWHWPAGQPGACRRRPAAPHPPSPASFARTRTATLLRLLCWSSTKPAWWTSSP